VDNAGKEMTPEEFSRLMHVHGVNRQQLHSRLEPFLRQSFKVMFRSFWKLYSSDDIPSLFGTLLWGAIFL
jgi:hypothetical protein